MCVYKSRRQRDDTVIARQCLFHLAEVGLCGAEIAPVRHRVRVDRDGAMITFDRFRKTAELSQEIAAVAVGIGPLGFM